MSRGHFFGYAQQGGSPAVTGFLNSSNKFQKTYPGCTVKVTTDVAGNNLATLYSDAAGTPFANPFTAGTNGEMDFWTDSTTVTFTFSGKGITTQCGTLFPGYECISAFSWPNITINPTLAATTTVDVRDFGAVIDWRAVSDASINNTTTLTSATANFTSADIGKRIAVANAGAVNPTAAWFGNARLTLYTTIAGVTNATTITLGAAAQNSASGVSIIFASDSGTQIQDAIDSLYTSNGGPGYGTVLVPGYFMTSTSIEIDTRYAHVRLCGTSWMDSMIDHVGSSSNGAVYITGSTVNISGQLYASNGNYTEIFDLSIRSGNGHGINMDACLNSRVQRVWIVSASTNHALWRIIRGGILEANNIRLGGGNLSAGSTALPPFDGINVDPAHYGIHATNDTDSLITELHFTNVQLHASVTSYGVICQATASGLHAAFDIQFLNCQIKNDANTTASSYFLDGVEATLVDCYSEQSGGSAEMVRVKATNENADVTLVGCRATGPGTLVIDRSGSATKTVRVAIDAVSSFGSISTAGTNSAMIVVGDYFFTPDYAAGNFTANGAQTWTVGSGDVTTYKMSVSGKKATLCWHLASTDVGGTPNTQLLLKIPFGWISAGTFRDVQTYTEDGGTTKVLGSCFVTPGATNVVITKLNTANWANTTGQTETYGKLVFEVQ